MLRVAKLTLLVALIFIAVVVAFQNLTAVQIRMLFWTIHLPQAAILSATLLIGFLIGLITAAVWNLRSRRARQIKGNS